MVKILCLGNEFLKEDSLAKEIGRILSGEHEIIEIKDTFELMTSLNEINNPLILDVVKKFDTVRVIGIDDLKTKSIISAHDFDAAQIIKLIGKPVKIIGIPLKGDVKEITEQVKTILRKEYSS